MTVGLDASQMADVDSQFAELAEDSEITLRGKHGPPSWWKGEEEAGAEAARLAGFA